MILLIFVIFCYQLSQCNARVRYKHPTSTSVEVEKRETDIRIFWKSKDRMSEEKKRKKSSRANTQDDINAKGASDSPTADEPAATE